METAMFAKMLETLSILFGVFPEAEVTHVRISSLKISCKRFDDWETNIMQGKYWV
jgi:hypothetical protein